MTVHHQVCGLSQCGLPVHANSVSCPDCLDVPYDDVSGTISCHHYCSHQHLSVNRPAHAQECQSRRLWRYMIRIGAVLDLLFLRQREALFRFRIGQASLDNEGDLNVEVSPALIVGEPVVDREMDVSERMVLGAMSFDQCRQSIALITPLLAWLIEGLPLQIHERDLKPEPKHGRPWVYFDLDRSYKIAETHTVLTLTASISSPLQYESLTLDPTSMQYGRRVKGHQSFEYFQERARPGAQARHDFGRAFEDWKQEFRRAERGSVRRREFMFSHLAIVIGDEVVEKMLHRIGGREELFTMSHSGFLDLKNEIGRQASRELGRLRFWAQKIRAANGQLDDQLQKNLQQHVHRKYML